MQMMKEIEKPKIDIELYGADSNINPTDKVRIMDEDSFEHFTLEWLYGTKKVNYASMKKIGGSGDKGRDVIAYYKDGTVDYFQCKQYQKSLAPTDFYLELGKLCYYTFNNQIKLPKTYYIVASNDVGPTLHDLIDNPDKLRQSLKENWDSYCKTKITRNIEIPLAGDLFGYVDKFDFSIIKTYPIAQIVDEYLDTIYGAIRFGGRRPKLNDSPCLNETIEADEMIYIGELLKAYSDELKTQIDTVEMLKNYKKYFEHLNRQRKDYYSAETIRRFVRDTLTDSKQLDVLKEEIYDGIIDTHEQSFETGYKRLVDVLIQATRTTTSKSLLDSKLNYIGNSQRKGVCHMLVNDQKISWVDVSDE